MVVYPIFANWVWGGGWLAQLGAQLRPRPRPRRFRRIVGRAHGRRRRGARRRDRARPAHRQVHQDRRIGRDARPRHADGAAGTFILAFGWFGFNPGSTLAGGDLRIAVVATNTMLAGTGGAIAAMFYVWKRFGKPDPSMMCNGMLAGLVAITAPCAFVNSVSAVIIGAIAGVLVVDSVLFIDGRSRSTIRSARSPCTACAALWRALGRPVRRRRLRRRLERRARHREGPVLRRCVAVRGAGHRHADLHRLGLRALLSLLQDRRRIMGNRVSAEAELEGLDMPEMGALGYPDFVLGPSTPGWAPARSRSRCLTARPRVR